MGRTALIGSNGQLGSDISRLWAGTLFGQQGEELINLTHADIEVADEDAVRSILGGIQPTTVINTAAYHRVDECERRPYAAFNVNGLGVKNLAEACRDLGATLVHISTDYVFEGTRSRPYTETDATGPINAYGISKLAGESFARYILPDNHIIVRSSGLYGPAGASGKGGNFIETMLRLAREGRPISVVSDQVTCPTYTGDLAPTILEVIRLGGRGTFHITNGGHCSWFEFAKAIFSSTGVTAEVSPTTAAAYGAAARRPAYSVLDNKRLRELGVEPLQPWRAALAEYFRVKGTPVV